jgi:hypothetical protein
MMIMSPGRGDIWRNPRETPSTSMLFVQPRTRSIPALMEKVKANSRQLRGRKE